MIRFRVLDIVLSLAGVLLFIPLFSLVFIIGLFDTGAPLFIQTRVGRNQKPFALVKFRSMKKNAASVPTHLADATAITTYGRFLRHTKLDELPQLWNVLKGDMSMVGPRPGLFNQEELTEERIAKGVFAVRPGITGLAQINSVDMSTPRLLAETDQRMIATLTVRDYLKYIVLTVSGRGSGDRVFKKE